MLRMIEKMRMLPKSKPVGTMLEVSLIALELYLAVPLAIAYYP